MLNELILCLKRKASTFGCLICRTRSFVVFLFCPDAFSSFDHRFVATMIYQRCSPISRFQFATIAFLCTVYFPYTFHSNVWSLLIQPIDQQNCSDVNPQNSSSNLIFQLFNRSICCSCEKFSQNRDFYRTCRFWHDELRQIDRRKLTLLDEVRFFLRREIFSRFSSFSFQWSILCQRDHRFKLFRASLTFFLAEILGLIFFAVLADRFGRKVILLICLYIPVVRFDRRISTRRKFFIFSFSAFRFIGRVYDEFLPFPRFALARRIFQQSFSFLFF